MKSVLISIRPQWVEKICHKIGEDETGKAIYEKRIEVRKSAPKEVPFKAYIYATRPKKYYKCGKVSTSDELLWLANGKVEMGDGFKFWADGDEYQCLNGRIIGEFICDKVYPIKNRGSSFSVADEEQSVTNEIARQSCLYYDDMVSYFGNKDGFGWHISDLKIYDKPKKVSEFYKPCSQSKNLDCDWLRNHNVCSCSEKKSMTRPPQSWQYVEEL